MAKQTQIIHTDDLTGAAIEDNDAPTVSFALDGVAYEIDLNDKNQEKMRKALAVYVEAARKVSKSKTASKRTENPAEIRAWAKDAGYDVPDRGRIPAEIRQAYNAR